MPLGLGVDLGNRALIPFMADKHPQGLVNRYQILLLSQAQHKRLPATRFTPSPSGLCRWLLQASERCTWTRSGLADDSAFAPAKLTS
jgi:hypothetical protein